MSEAEEIDGLRTALLRGLGKELGPDDGYEAFERHQLLAIRFHRAARLNAPEIGDRPGWRQFFLEHFPRGDEHALLLWEKWRNTLVKDERPGSGVLLTHANPVAHWKREPTRGLIVDLGSMETDFRSSVDSLVSLIERDAERRDATLEAWRARQWIVENVVFVTGEVASTSAVSASFRS